MTQLLTSWREQATSSLSFCGRIILANQHLQRKISPRRRRRVVPRPCLLFTLFSLVTWCTLSTALSPTLSVALCQTITSNLAWSSRHWLCTSWLAMVCLKVSEFAWEGSPTGWCTMISGQDTGSLDKLSSIALKITKLVHMLCLTRSPSQEINTGLLDWF